MGAEVDELLVEEPGELELQRGVVVHLARQHHALPNGDVQRGRLGGNDGRLWNTSAQLWLENRSADLTCGVESYMCPT